MKKYRSSDDMRGIFKILKSLTVTSPGDMFTQATGAIMTKNGDKLWNSHIGLYARVKLSRSGVLVTCSEVSAEVVGDEGIGRPKS